MLGTKLLLISFVVYATGQDYVTYNGGSNVRTQGRLPPRPLGPYRPANPPNAEPIRPVYNTQPDQPEFQPQPVYQPPQPYQPESQTYQPGYQPRPLYQPPQPEQPTRWPINSYPRPLPPWSWKPESRTETPAETIIRGVPATPELVYPELSPAPPRYDLEPEDSEFPMEPRPDQAPVEQPSEVLQPEVKAPSSSNPEDQVPETPEPLSGFTPPANPELRPIPEEPLTDPIPDPEQPITYPDPLLPIDISQPQPDDQPESYPNIIPGSYPNPRPLPPQPRPVPEPALDTTPEPESVTPEPAVPSNPAVSEPNYQPVEPLAPVDHSPVYEPFSPSQPIPSLMQMQPLQPPRPIQSPRPNYRPIPSVPVPQPLPSPQPAIPNYQPQQPPAPANPIPVNPGIPQPLPPQPPAYEPWKPPTPYPTLVPSPTPETSQPTPQPTIGPAQPPDISLIIPMTDFQCRKGNGYYPIINECDTYIKCQNQRAFKHSCPDGLHFNPQALYPEYPCAYPSEVQCESTSSKQIARPTNECPNRYGFYPILGGDCSKYIMCQEGKATSMNCPFGLVFNDQLSSCDWPENVPQCNPSAFKDFNCPMPPEDDPDLLTKYRYGSDCGMYVACQRGHPRLLRCDRGLSFDKNSQVCIDSELISECNNIHKHH